MVRRLWTRDELIVAFNLYCRIPFGRIHPRNPEVISLAKALRRSPSAVSWKLANFARLDPEIRGRNRTGATHGAKLEQVVWDEFNHDWDRLAFESEELRSRLVGAPLETDIREEFPEGRTRAASVMVRVNQGFFRAAVLAAYDGMCCVTGLGVSQLLCASHIIPWSVDSENRTNPRNGLCLNALHDRAFDRGLISFDKSLRLLISPSIGSSTDVPLANLLLSYEGTLLRSPNHFRPDPGFLEYHRNVVFKRI
jgi:putative restriction endonuclease